MPTKENGNARLKSRQSLGYFLLIPSTLLIIFISFVPLIYGVFLSFTNRHFLKPDQRDFIGLENYRNLFQDKEFFGVLSFSFQYTLTVVAVSFLVGFVLALLLNRDMKFRGIYRTLVLIPWVIPPVVAMTNFLWVLNDQIGIINTTLRALELIDKPILFIANPKITRLTVMMIGAWKNTPFMMVTILAGLQSIPNDMYEAAHIDGAGFWRSLWHLTLPMIKTVAFISTTLMFIWTFNNFENIWLLTRGGPNDATFTLPILSYYTAFYRSHVSYAAAIATTMMIVMLILSLVYLRLQFGPGERLEKKLRHGKPKQTAAPAP